MYKHKDKFVFKMLEHLKQSRPGFDNPDVTAKAYPVDRRICVYTVLKEYMKRTRFLRSDSNSYLLISYIKPHDKVSVGTVSRWIRNIMHKSGIDTTQFKAHSTRAAASSKALNNNASVETILKLAGWSHQSTFTKLYRRKVKRSTDVTEAILK